MSCCEELKTLTIFKNFPTHFGGRPLVVMNFTSEGTSLTGFKAYFTLNGITREFDDITVPCSVDFTAEETGTFPIGLNYADIIVEDPVGHKHPFSTAIPCLVKDFVEGDIELDNFNVTITTDIQENTIVINFEGGSGGTFAHDELIHRDYDDQHPISAITGLEDRLGATETALEQEIQDRQDGDTTLQQNIDTEALNRGNADTALGNRISTEEQARIDEDEALDQRIDEVVGDLDDHIQDKNNPHEVTKAQVGLGNVDNLSSMDMPVSTAQGNAIQAVQDNLDDETDARQEADTKIRRDLNWAKDDIKTNADDLKDRVLSLDEIVNVLDFSYFNRPIQYRGETDQYHTNGYFYVVEDYGYFTYDDIIVGSFEIESIDEDKFWKKARAIDVHTFEYITIDGENTWSKDGRPVNLDDYGIVLSGDINIGDKFEIDIWMFQGDSQIDVQPHQKIKTINNQTMVGTGNISVATAEQGSKADSALQPSSLSATSPIAYNSTTKKISVASGYQIPTTAQITTFTNKQDALVSGTNIKTVNGGSILGSGNLEIDALPSQTGNTGKQLKTNGTSASWDYTVIVRDWGD